jgi:hypothetical protein
VTALSLTPKAKNFPNLVLSLFFLAQNAAASFQLAFNISLTTFSMPLYSTLSAKKKQSKSNNSKNP